MFEATRPFAFFDYFRIPYQVAKNDHPRTETHGLIWTDTGRILRWLAVDPTTGISDRVAPRGHYRLCPGQASGHHQANGQPAGITIFGHVMPDEHTRQLLTVWGREWQPVDRIVDALGRPVASVWRDRDGNVVLPFDPGELMWQCWSEGYQATAQVGNLRRLRPLLVRAYYALRPAIPRPLQIRLRQLFTHVQERASFPGWPTETALHDLYAWLFTCVTELSGRPVPWIDFWPDRYSWALVLTHDVETAAGCQLLPRLRDIERDYGLRSSWNFVPLRYPTDEALLDGLKREGCEIGVHGLRHDGRDLGSRRLLARRLPAMREHAKRWGAVGFRAPATQRMWDQMPLLGFDYDSSYHDTAPYEPQPGGSASLLPYFIDDPGSGGVAGVALCGGRGTVELPITLPQDHTLFEILQHADATVWLDKVTLIRKRRGMALVLTHPDYASDDRVVEGYRHLLETYHNDPQVWHALPREVTTWWRRRADSHLEEVAGTWRIHGPAATDGQLRFTQAGNVEGRESTPDVPELGDRGYGALAAGM